MCTYFPIACPILAYWFSIRTIVKHFLLLYSLPYTEVFVYVRLQAFFLLQTVHINIVSLVKNKTINTNISNTDPH
jgi:hypothetical protein